MENVDSQINEEKYKQFYNKAKKRVNFKIHLTVFVLVNALLWLVWFFVFKNTELESGNHIFLKSINFFTLFWLVLLIGHYFIAFKWNKSLVEKELKTIIENEKKRIQRDNQHQENTNENI